MLDRADLATNLLQGLYASEINFTFGAFWDCRLQWQLGDTINGFVAEGSVTTFEQAASDLAQAAVQHLPNSAFARSYQTRRIQ